MSEPRKKRPPGPPDAPRCECGAPFVSHKHPHAEDCPRRQERLRRAAPSSPSNEAMERARRFLLGDLLPDADYPVIRELAHTLDAFAEQRVRAERERCLRELNALRQSAAISRDRAESAGRKCVSKCRQSDVETLGRAMDRIRTRDKEQG